MEKNQLLTWIKNCIEEYENLQLTGDLTNDDVAMGYREGYISAFNLVRLYIEGK